MDHAFNCGHERSPQNTTSDHRCRRCRRAYHRGYARVSRVLLKAMTASAGAAQ